MNKEKLQKYYLTKLSVITFFFAINFCIASEGNDSWYAVRNYEGKIGNHPIHLSIQ